MMEHTPGQWRILRVTENNKLEFAIVGPMHVNADDCQWIADTFGQWTEAESLANARLIAAAPELLAACEAALGYIDGEVDHAESWGRPADKELQEIFNLLLNAIAKAKRTAAE